MKDFNSPPRWAIRFFQWLCNDHLSEPVLGDLLHLYDRRVKTIGRGKADFLFVMNVLQFIQPFAIRQKSKTYTANHLTMYKNYFTVAWRNMSFQKMYAFIKIGGFALGLATCIVIALYIRHELSYDKHYADVHNIYRLYSEESGPDGGKWTAFPAPLASLVKENFPEVLSAARLIPYKWYDAGQNLVRRDDQIENTFEEGFAYADNALLEILEIPMVYGSQSNALLQPNSIVISREKAEKYFPGQDPIGKLLVLNDEKDATYTIGGVMENFRPTSHLQFDFFLTLSGKEFWQGEQTSWCCWNYNPYIKLKPGTDYKIFETKLQSLKKVYIEYLIKEKNQYVEDVKKYYSFRVQPVEDVYLHSNEIHDIIPHGDMRYIWMFGGVAIFILALASINFINLSTAKSANRAKEVGLRKVVGSNRSALVNQFLSEAILYSFVSFVLAIVILSLGLPYFNELAGKSIVVPWGEWWFSPLLLGVALFVGITAGLYPSFYLSSFKPIDVLKGSVARGMKNSNLRSTMVVFQFTASIVLIIGTFVIYQQMNFILTTKIGYDKEQVLMIDGIETLKDQQPTFKEELLKLSGIENVTLTQYFPVAGTKRDQNQFWREGKSQEEKSFGAQAWWVDEDYIETMGMKMTQGRNFKKDFASDSSAIIINESMAKRFGFANPVGERIMNWRTWTIIGVVEDFHFGNMKEKIEPLCFMRGDRGSIAAVKLNTDDMQGAISTVTDIWKKFLPHQPIRYSFLDESYARMYDDVRRTGDIFASFAILAIIVACLGLFALSSFMVEQRRKEISIRLVLGASLQNIFRMLTSHFMMLVCISLVLAVPLAWYIMQQWLADYEYKVNMGWDIFVLAGTLSIVIAISTVSYQAVRAALANPANSLRTE